MSEGNIESEALPSTSQSADVQKTAIFPLVRLPKVVLTKLDLGNLPVPVYTGTSPVKKSVKRLTTKKNKPIISKNLPKKSVANVKHDTRTRNRPKKDYKVLSEIGKSPIELTKNKTQPGKSGGIVKKVPKLTATQEDNTVKGMLKKTMLQKRSKIAIPPAKRAKVLPTKSGKTALPPKPKKEKENSLVSTLKNDVLLKIKETALQMDTDASEDEFLYDELIDELVNPRKKKSSGSEKTTNITLKPNAGNKPPTIVKGGIVKKSSLPPDLKSVASPTTLNSSKLTGTALNSKIQTTAVENAIKTPDTAETTKASLPIKASPFPIAINSSPSKTGPKDQGKKGQKKSAKPTSVMKEDPPPTLNTPISSFKQTKVSQKPKPEVKSAVPISRPRGRPKMGPKEVIKSSPIVKTTPDDESDEYTEIETLENIDTDHVELLPSLVNDSTRNEDIKVITNINPKSTIEPKTDGPSRINSKKDEDPHLDLLRILTDDTEDTQSEPSELKEVNAENTHNNPGESPKPSVITTSDPPNLDTRPCEISNNPDTDNSGSQESENSCGPQADESSSVHDSERTSDSANNLNKPVTEAVVEATPPVRTIYDLMTDVALQYPSWNLHIIPETNAFCIAQVTRGRLGLPTLKKCIELDPDTYSAKVYIHQYHIKRFDGIYDSEEAILALIEEIHFIKA